MFEEWDILLENLPSLGIKIGFAVLCGMIIGFERELKTKPAGLKTIVLITVGSTLYVIIGSLIPMITEGPFDIIRTDPGRIAAQVVTGVGFLGAGAIIQSSNKVAGLTTAAVIWVAAAIGLFIGFGFPLLALATTIVIEIVMLITDKIERRMEQRTERSPQRQA